jgi:hypothetical protein
MEELPIAVQMKLRGLPGAESGVQRVDLILEDGRVVPEVAVADCTYVEETNFEAHLVADVRLPAAPPSPRRAFFFLVFILLGILAHFWLLRVITPESSRERPDTPREQKQEPQMHTD